MDDRMAELNDHLKDALARLDDPVRQLWNEARTRQEAYAVMSEALDDAVALLQVHLRDVDFDESVDVIRQHIEERFTRYVVRRATTETRALTNTVVALFPVLMELFLLAQSNGALPLENAQHTRQLGDELIRRRLRMDCPYDPPMLGPEKE